VTGPLVSLDRAARDLGVHPETLILWRRQGRLRGELVDRRLYFRRSTIDAFVEAARIEPGTLGEYAKRPQRG
jgi:hypothetical protein